MFNVQCSLCVRTWSKVWIPNRIAQSYERRATNRIKVCVVITTKSICAHFFPASQCRITFLNVYIGILHVFVSPFAMQIVYLLAFAFCMINFFGRKSDVAKENAENKKKTASKYCIHCFNLIPWYFLWLITEALVLG